MKSPRKFAAFDIDWTLHHSALGTDLLLALSRAGLIEKDLEQHYVEWQNAADKAAYFNQHFNEFFHSGFATITKTQFERIGHELATKTEQTIITELRNAIEQHRTNGAFLIAITNSPSIAALPLTQLLKFDMCVAPEFIYDETGIYTGAKIRSAEEKDKGIVLAKLVDAHNLTWKDGTAYGDSMDDLPMLERVEQPVAVNPTPELRRIAEDRAWNIIDTEENA